MSNANLPEDKPTLPEEEQLPPKNVELPNTEPLEVPPYRQPAQAKKNFSNNWFWLAAAMVAMLAIGVFLANTWVKMTKLRPKQRLLPTNPRLLVKH